jgi:hypothetical protein
MKQKRKHYIQNLKLKTAAEPKSVIIMLLGNHGRRSLMRISSLSIE